MSAMKLIFETRDRNAYLQPSAVIDFPSPPVQDRIAQIRAQATDDETQARLAFAFVRDHIAHSFDLNSARVTISASQALTGGEGICFAKAHLLAALLRGLNIPAGFCYQRVMRRGTPESGYALHGLNAVYLPGRQVWFRLDPRGNKPGVNSQFSVECEQLAYPIRPELGEVDYPYVFVAPRPEVLACLHASADGHELFYKRPAALAAGEGLPSLAAEPGSDGG
ncbi:MAG TPA: transglutaminase family protein [Verrucomicrobiota bacterium]|nr:transglutaminase family protein [Verrucomicrobiota bacterium]HNT15686.1 transglutaminase family protein [Verrucomicrobiota bacterium]